jgi:myosin-crossreactive antigen
VSVDGVQVDQYKIFTIVEWPTSRSIHDVWSFHDLAYFYRKFIKNFNSLIAPIIECLKGYTFHWTYEAKTNFQMVKQKMTKATMLALPDFEKLFEINCDASRIGIGGVLS